jgi:hypothetical protein
MRKKNELKILATGEQYIKDDDKRKIIERWFDCECNEKWVDVISWEDIEGQEMDENNTKKYCDVKCPRCKKITRCAEAIIYNAALESGFPTMIYEEGGNISYIPEEQTNRHRPKICNIVKWEDEKVIVQPSKFKWLIASAILLIVMLSLFVSVFNFIVN